MVRPATSLKKGHNLIFFSVNFTIFSEQLLYRLSVVGFLRICLYLPQKFLRKSITFTFLFGDFFFLKKESYYLNVIAEIIVEHVGVRTLT